jgi:two-component system, sensor histidine kinase
MTEPETRRASSPGRMRAVLRLRATLAESTIEAESAAAGASLSLLLDALERGDVPDLSGLSVTERPAWLGLVQELRGRLLDEALVDRDTAEEVVHLLRDLQRVEEALQNGVTRELRTTLLSSAGGAELMMELAHDLRSPLTSVLFLSEALRNGQSGPINELQRRQLGIIYSAAMSLVSMAGDVIDLVRGGESLVETEPAPFSLRRTLATVSDLVRPMLEEKEVELRTRGPEADVRRGFPLAINRVLLNLATNAIRSTPHGFVEIWAREVGRGWVEFGVCDSGDGLPAEVIDHLSGAETGNSSRRRGPVSNTGLGLSICQRLLSLMGSGLEVESAPGRGTRFTFILELPEAEAGTIE